MDEIPSFFSDKKDILNYDYNKVTKLYNSNINHYQFIKDLIKIIHHLITN